MSSQRPVIRFPRLHNCRLNSEILSQWSGTMWCIQMPNIYDSSARTNYFKELTINLWDQRDLISLLVKRDIAVRYKRSVLGLLWTLINPLLTSLVLWMVFVQIFRAKLADGSQFAPYVLAGVLLMTFFNQAFMQATESIASGMGILQKVYVRPHVFAFASAISNSVNFILGLFALVVVTFLVDEGISLLAPLTVLVIFCMLSLTIGLSLMTSILFVRFNDSKNIIAIILQLLFYLTPVFYPKDILNETVRLIVSLNPLSSYLDIFRFVFADTGKATLFDWVYMFSSSTIVLLLGLVIFKKAWAKSVVMM
jgi:ABC-2 type transport system permease protein